MFLYLAITLSFAMLSSAAVFRLPAHVPENTYETCSLKLDRGDGCCPRPNNTIRYFFDPELEDCFPYLYEGCGGGRNTFYTEYECRTTCIPADKFVCGGNKAPTGSCKDPERSCPAGSTCVIGFGGGLCCDDANEKQWDTEARNPTCPVGKVLTRTREYGQEAWIGKSCSHRFCPYGYDCIQGDRIAHCCGPIPNFREKLYPEDDNSISNDEYSKARPFPGSGQRPQTNVPESSSNGYRRYRYRNKH
ncbi:hypothetical protein V3C99_003403 [Haemonchus contortus]